VRIQGEIRTLTAQARASGWIITILPVGLAGFLALISPTYFDPMITDPLGHIMLGVAIFSDRKWAPGRDPEDREDRGLT